MRKQAYYTLSPQITTAQKKVCELAFSLSFMRLITDSMNITFTQDNKRNSIAPLMLLPGRTEHLQSPEKILFPSPSLAELKTVMTSTGYNLSSSLDFNDTEAIRRNLHWEGDRAAVITIDSFNKKTGEKIRKAMHQERLRELAFKTKANNMSHISDVKRI